MASEEVTTLADNVASQAKNKNWHWHTIYKVSGVLNPEPIGDSSIGFEGNVENISNKRLSMVIGNMDAEEELLLRSYLISKINMWSVKENNVQLLQSSVISFENNELIEDTNTQLYYRGIKNDKNNTESDISYMICFITASKSGLELFQNDLDKYSSKLVPYLEKYLESVDISDCLTKLNRWYEVITPYVKKCLDAFDYGLANLFCAGLCGDTVQIEDGIPQALKESVERFLQCCSLSELFMKDFISNEENPLKNSFKDLIALDNPETVVVSKTSDGSYTVTPRRNSTFCEDCIKQLKVNVLLTPIEMRQLIENYKLKCIRDMNTFKRLLTRAETDYYTCYRAFLFLVTSGNGIVLMRNSRLQSDVEKGKGGELLDILQQFVHKMGGYGVIDTKERKEILNNKILNL